MGAKARLEGELSWTDSSFVRGIAKATTLATTFGKTVQTNVGAKIAAGAALAGTAIATYLGIHAFENGIHAATALGGELNDLFTRSGIGIKTLIGLQQVLKDNGVESSSLGQSINKMQKELSKMASSGRQTNPVLNDLGLKLKDLKGLDPGAQFIKIGKAINDIKDPSVRAATAMAIFGKSAGGLLSVFADERFGTVPVFLEKQAEVLARDADLFDSVSDKLDRSGRVAQGFWIGVADKVAPVLNKMMDKFESIDWVGIGQQFGNSLINAANFLAGAFENPGKALELIWKSSLAGAATVGNLLAAGFNYAGQVFNNLFASAPEMVTAFGQGLALALMAAVKLGLAALVKVPIYFAAGMTTAIEYATSKIAGMKISLGDVLKFFAEGWGRALLDPVSYLTTKLGELALKFGKAMWDALKGNFGSTSISDLLNFGADTSWIKSITDGIQKGIDDANGVGLVGEQSFGAMFDSNKKQLEESNKNLVDSAESLEKDAAEGFKAAGDRIAEGAAKAGQAVSDAAVTVKDVFGAEQLEGEATAARNSLINSGSKITGAMASGADTVAKAINGAASSAASKIEASTASSERDKRNVDRFGFVNRGEKRSFERQQAREQQQFERGVNGRTTFEKQREGFNPEQRQQFEAQQRESAFNSAFGKGGAAREKMNPAGGGDRDWQNQFRRKDQQIPVGQPVKKAEPIDNKKNEVNMSDEGAKKIAAAVDKLLPT